MTILQSPHKAQPGMAIFNTMSPGHQQLIQWLCSNRHYIPTILSYRLISQIFEKILHALRFIIMIRSGHNFAHATTAQLLWHVQNCVLIGSLCFTWEQHIFFKNLDYELVNYMWTGLIDKACLATDQCLWINQYHSAQMGTAAHAPRLDFTGRKANHTNIAGFVLQDYVN